MVHDVNRFFTRGQETRRNSRLRFGQLKTWEIYLKCQHGKVLEQREKKEEAARLKAAMRRMAGTPIPTPTASKAEE